MNLVCERSKSARGQLLAKGSLNPRWKIQGKFLHLEPLLSNSGFLLGAGGGKIVNPGAQGLLIPKEFPGNPELSPGINPPWAPSCKKTQFLHLRDCEKLRISLKKSAENAALVAEKWNLRKHQRLNREKPNPPFLLSQSHDLKFHFPAVHVQG